MASLIVKDILFASFPPLVGTPIPGVVLYASLNLYIPSSGDFLLCIKKLAQRSLMIAASWIKPDRVARDIVTP